MRRIKKQRHRLKPAERRKMILDTAATLIAARGWWVVTLVDIAAACPIYTSIGTLCYYFPRRELLADELLQDARIPDRVKEDIRAATV